MDYLIGLQLIVFLSVLGLAILIGARFSQLNVQSEKMLSISRSPFEKNQAEDQKNDTKTRKLKDDFWDKLSHRS